MRKAAIICLCTLFAGTGLCWFVARSQSVAWSLTEQMRSGPGTVIDFAELSPLPWNRLYIFGPYTSHEHIHRCLGFRWPGMRWTSIGDSDRVNLVVFVRNEEVIHWFEYPRKRGELGGLANAIGYARGDALFRVQLLSEDGRLELVHDAR